VEAFRVTDPFVVVTPSKRLRWSQRGRLPEWRNGRHSPVTEVPTSSMRRWMTQRCRTSADDATPSREWDRGRCREKPLLRPSSRGAAERPSARRGRHDLSTSFRGQ